MKKIVLKLKNQKYPIIIFSKPEKTIFELFSSIAYKKAVIITDQNVSRLYLNQMLYFFLDMKIKIEKYIIPSGETNKSYKTFNKIISYLIKKNHGRDTTLIALGGGVIGDLVGFVAATYKRGISYIQYPTTLLSQIDASIGGKNGINHKYGKNMVGTIYHPRFVAIDINFLKTLPARELSSGLAEMIKYAISFDKRFFFWLESNIKNILKLKKKTLIESISHCCFLKAKIVSIDEKETNQRMLLNFGHTYGHAIEAHTEYKRYLHGEAISIGIMMALYVAKKNHQFCYTNRIKKLFKKSGLPVCGPHNMKPKDYMQYIINDKKYSQKHKFCLILPETLGKVQRYFGITTEILFKSIEKNTCSK